MLNKDCLVVVADGRRAKIFRNSARHGIDLTHVETLEAGDMPAGTHGVDMPLDHNDKDATEATFARFLAKKLNAMAQAGDLHQVAIAADPSTLGYMRHVYDDALRARIARELPKRIVDGTAEDIAAAFG